MADFAVLYVSNHTLYRWVFPFCSSKRFLKINRYVYAIFGNDKMQCNYLWRFSFSSPFSILVMKETGLTRMTGNSKFWIKSAIVFFLYCAANVWKLCFRYWIVSLLNNFHALYWILSCAWIPPQVNKMNKSVLFCFHFMDIFWKYLVRERKMRQPAKFALQQGWKFLFNSA